MSETPTLAKFQLGKQQDGLSQDGLPFYRNVTEVVLSRPPYLKITRVATEEDFHIYRDPYELFLKELAAAEREPDDEGFPLALWPPCTPALLAMLAARGVSTIEGLERLATSRPQGLPGELLALAERAAKTIEMSKNVGQFEVMVSDRDNRIEVLNEQIRELKAAIEARDAVIVSLKQRVA